MDDEQVDIIVRNIEALLKIERAGIKNANQLAKKAKIDQKTANNMLTTPRNPSLNPTIKVVGKIAKAFQLPVWMLSVRDFPFHAVNNSGLIQSISEEGYALLRAFDGASDETKKIMLRQMSFLLLDIENNKRGSAKVSEVAQRYNQTLG